MSRYLTECCILPFILAALHCLQCQTMPADFDDDYLRRSDGNSFTFNPAFQIVPDQTTTEDLHRAYPGAARKRISFPEGYARQWQGKTIQVDQILVYGLAKNRVETVSLDSGQMAKTDYTMETLTLAVFLFQGVVQGYAITHRIREVTDGDFRPGPYDTGPTPAGDVYPGSRGDMQHYSRLRGKDWACAHGFYDICDPEGGRSVKTGREPTAEERGLLEDVFDIDAESAVVVDEYKGTRNTDGARFLTREYFVNATGMGYKLDWLLNEEDEIVMFCGFSAAIGPCASPRH